MSDEQKTLFDACMKQAEYFHNRFHQRREYEWKITVSIWTLMVGGIAFVKHPLSVPYPVTATLIAGYVFFWLKRIWEVNDRDKELAKYYQHEADCVMRKATHLLGDRPILESRRFYDLSFLADWSMRFQVLAGIVLAFLFYSIQR